MTPIFFSRPQVLCSAGSNLKELWQSVTTGNQSGIKKVQTIDKNVFYAARIDDSLLSQKSSSRYDSRIMRIEEKCLSQLENEISHIKKLFSPERIAVCTGSCDNGTELSLNAHKEFFNSNHFPKNYSLEAQGADYVSTFISEKYNLKGPSLTFSTACSSSAAAIVKATEMIQSDLCDAVICGGIDIASDTALMGFNSLEAISSEITNPFSKNRHGITLGEGAAFFILSRTQLFPDENIKILGYGESADAYHITTPDPEGNGAFSSMQKALEKAQIAPEQIDYLNLHGTGTKFNDSMEAKAVSKLFKNYPVPASSTKSITGHTLGASGAIEAVISYLTIKNNTSSKEITLPVQVWDKIYDPEIPKLNLIDPSTPSAKKTEQIPIQKISTVMSNSFAFGGANTSLIFGL